MLAAAFTVSRPVPLPPVAAALEPTFDHAERLPARAGALARSSRPLAGLSPASAGAAPWVADKLSSLGLATRVDRFPSTSPAAGASTCGTSAPSFRVARATRSRRRAPRLDTRSCGDERQRLRHGGSHRARPRVLGHAHDRGRSQPERTPCSFARPMPARTGCSVRGGSLEALRRPSTSWQSSSSTRSLRGSRRGWRSQARGHGLRHPGSSPLPTRGLPRRPGSTPELPGALAQLIDLGFPFSLTEQYAFLAEHIPALTVTTEGAALRGHAAETPRRGRARPDRQGGGRTAGIARREPRAGDAGRAPTSTSAVAWSGVGRSRSYTSRCSFRSCVCLADLVARLRRWGVPLAAGGAQLPPKARLLALRGRRLHALRLGRRLAGR